MNNTEFNNKEDSKMELDIPFEEKCNDLRSIKNNSVVDERMFGINSADLSLESEKTNVTSILTPDMEDEVSNIGTWRNWSCFWFNRSSTHFMGNNSFFSFLRKISCTHFFDKYTKEIGRNISMVATIYPRSLLIIGNVLGLMFGLIVALGLMKLSPFYLEVKGSPDLFLPTNSIHNTHKEELKSLFGLENVNVPILYSNRGPPGSSLLDYVTLKQIWKNEMAIQSIKVVDKSGKEWTWEDICHHQPTGSILTGTPCIVLSMFGLFMINDSNGIFTDEDFDAAYTGECCGGISIKKFAAGNLIKQSYFPYEYDYDKNLPEWPFELKNTQEMLSIYRLNTSIPEDVRISWENKVTDLVKSVQKKNQLSITINKEHNHLESQISNNVKKNHIFSEIQVDNNNKDITAYPNNWGIVHYSVEYVSSETTELANKETPLLLATFALMIIFMAICISGKFPKKSRVLLSSTVVLITVYATVGSFATGMLLGVPISPLTPLFIHMLLGVVVSYMIISVRTYLKTRIYLRVSYQYLPFLNPKYVRLSGNEVFLEITQYIYKPWKGFIYQDEDNQLLYNERLNPSTDISSAAFSSLSCSDQKNSFQQFKYIDPNIIRIDVQDETKKNFPNLDSSTSSSIINNVLLDSTDKTTTPEKYSEDLISPNDRRMWDSDTLLKIRLSVSGSVVFSSITLTCLTSCAALFLGTVVDFPIVRYYCIHAGFGILYLFVFHWLIFLPSFALDEKRIYRRKCDVLPLIRFKLKNKKTSYLFKYNKSQVKSTENSNTNLLNTTSSMETYSRNTPSNMSLSMSNDSRKGTILSIFTRHVYKVRREVVKNYQRYKTWWGDKTSKQDLSETKLKFNDIDNIDSKDSSVVNKESENIRKLVIEDQNSNLKMNLWKVINEIDMQDIWIGRLMVESSKADVIMRLMCNFTFRLFACFFFLVVVILGIVYGKKVNTEFSAVRYLPPNSPLHHFEETLAKSWGFESRPMYIVVPDNNKISWNDRKVRINFINLIDNILLKDPAVMKPMVSWVHDFEDYYFGTKTIDDPDHIPSFIRECSPDINFVQPPPNNASKEEFYFFLNEWRNRKVIKGDELQEDTICVVSDLNKKLGTSTLVDYAPFIRNVIPEMHDETMLLFKNNDPKQGILAFRIMAMIKHDPLDSKSNYDTMIRLINLVETVFQEDFPGTHIYSDWFVEAERDFNILSIVWKLLLYITLGVSIMLCIIQNPLTGIFIGLVVGGINIIVILIMYVTGLIFDIVSFMVLATAVSFSIEYIVHITHLFLLTKRDSGVEKVRDSLLDMGPNVIYAVISTFLGIILLAFSTSESFKVFLWITTIVLCVSASTGIMIAPAILSIMFDFGNFIGDYYNNRKKDQEFSDSIIEMKTNNLL